MWIWAGLVAAALALCALMWIALRSRAPGQGEAPPRLVGGLLGRVRGLLAGRSQLLAEDRERLRELLLAADFGTTAVDGILERIAAGEGPVEDRLRGAVAEGLRPWTIDGLNTIPRGGTLLIVGVNGSGKTTTCAKVAHLLKARGDAVVLGAADTFRAAAAEQLGEWGRQLGVRVVRQQEGADPAAVAFDTIRAAAAGGATAVIDTAGRLHVDESLLNELRKVVRVCGKAREGAPDAVWLTLDAGQGQSAIEQARRFADAAPLAGIVVNKLDGEGKAGFLLHVVTQMRIPIVGVGVGEGITDFRVLDAQAYARLVVDGDRLA
jgi:fused signal recognition particle receptor